jgi:hypothetical protein
MDNRTPESADPPAESPDQPTESADESTDSTDQPTTLPDSLLGNVAGALAGTFDTDKPPDEPQADATLDEDLIAEPAAAIVDAIRDPPDDPPDDATLDKDVIADPAVLITELVDPQSASTNADYSERSESELHPSEESEHEPLPPEPSEPSETTEPPEPSESDDPESQITRMATTGELPDPAVQPDLLVYSRRREVEAILNDDYRAARRYKDSQTVLSRAIRDNQTKTVTNIWVDSLDARIAALRQKTVDLRMDWDDRIGEYETVVDDRRQKLSERHDQEIEDFEKECGSPQFRQRFSKASPHLLHIRQIQRQQALLTDFEAALQTKAVADQMQKAEEAESDARAVFWMQSEYKRIVDKHRSELAIATGVWDTHRRNLEKQRDEEIAVTNLAIGQLEYRKSLAPSSGVMTQPSVIVTTPRTRQILTQFKSSKDASRLTLPTRDFVQCIRPQPRSPQPFRPRTTKRYRGYV